MPDYRAEVVPDQPWEEDGTADVTPKPPCPITETKKLPLENREPTDMTIYRTDYPEGLVIIPTDSRPFESTAVLPLRTSDEESIFVGDDEHQDWPDGIVVMFTE